MSGFRTKLLLILSVLTMTVSTASAQATRTWVSGVGDDANPCSRTAPCKTFAGAISKTAAGGEISVLDPGGFGTVTITKAMTINGAGTLAGILAAGVPGVIVNAGSTDTVVLRGLSIEGTSTATHGVRYLAGGMLVIEDTTIDGFSQNGIDVSLGGSGKLAVKNTSITDGSAGVRITSTAGTVRGVLDGVTIKGAGTGVDVLFGAVALTNSTISHNSSFGALAENSGILTIENTMFLGNGTAIQSQSGATLRVVNSSLYDNLTGFGCGGGTLASAGNNRKGGNSGGSGGACSPNATVALQ
jgi:hypothetical protein